MNTFGNITLIQGDCMDFMRTQADKAFDLAIIDPPYGSGNNATVPHRENRVNGGDHKIYNTGTDIRKWDVPPTEAYFNELFRVTKNQIIWGGNYFGLPPTRCFVVWRKLSISERFSMAMCEYAWTNFNGNAKWIEIAPQGNKEKRFHPTQKPIKLYTWLLNHYAKEGYRILDTHLGSGSSAIAAYKLGFEFTGIEIDIDYYNKATQRIENEIKQLKIF